MKKLICLLSAAALLSSCGTYKKYKASMPVPEDLYGEVEATVDADNHLGTLAWREVFTDPQLQALIEKALENNTDLQTARLHVTEAEASLKVARLNPLPTLAFAPTATASSWDKGKATQTYSLPLVASWESNLYAQMNSLKRRSAKAAVEQMKDYQQAVQTQLIAGVANTYYTLLMLDEQIRIAESTEQTWKESLESTRAMMEAGMVTEAAVSQTEAAYYSVRTSVLDLKEQRHQVENALTLILAETPQEIARGSWERIELPATFSIGVPLQLLNNRPDVRASERGLAQAYYGVKLARANFMPTITLTGSAGWTNSAGSMIVNPGKLLATAIAGLTQPIFCKGQNSANLRIAKAQLEEAKLSYQQTVLNAGTEVNNLLSEYQTAQKKSAEYEKQVVALNRAVESTELLMKHGSTTYLEVLTARQSLLSSELTQVADRFSEIQSLINLYQAMGGGQDK